MGKLLVTIAIILAVTCMLVVLLTLAMCIPDGKWSINANAKGEMLFELVILCIGTPFSIWRILTRLLRLQQYEA